VLSISVIEDRAGLAALEREWNPLLARSRSDSLFLTTEWIDTYLEVASPAPEILVVVAREGGALVGVAPFMVAPGRGALGRRVRHLQFLAQDEVLYPEYLDLFVEPGRERELVPALLEPLLAGALSRRYDAILLEHVLASSPNLPILDAELARAGLRLSIADEIECPYASHPTTYEAYLETRTKHFRKRLSYNDRRLAREDDPRYLLGGTDIPALEALHEVVELNRARWGAEGKSFRTEMFTRFHERLCPLLEERGWLLLVLLRAGGRTVAAKYDFVYGGKVWSYQGGWTPELEKKEVGNVLLNWLIRRGVEGGQKEYDFLGGAAEYKDRFATGKRHMVDLVAQRRTPRGLALGLALAAKRELKERLAPERIARLKELAGELSRPRALLARALSPLRAGRKP
jgi:CelD/BcsL family acetyltransferase involved in cellulose biosynthesis